jgi:hypothetical protein
METSFALSRPVLTAESAWPKNRPKRKRQLHRTLVLSLRRKTTISATDLEAIVQNIDEEINRLEKVRALLSGHTTPLKRGFPPRKRSTMSAEGRARIAAAQKKRWAKKK